jgi:hypothetical protein
MEQTRHGFFLSLGKAFIEYKFLKGGFFGFFLFMNDIQHCFICRLSDSIVAEDVLNCTLDLTEPMALVDEEPNPSFL